MRRPRMLTVEQAAEGLTEAEQVLVRWDGEVAGKTKDADLLALNLAEQESRAGDDLLDDDDPQALAATAERLVHLRAEQGLALRAAGVARERLDAARRDVLRARSAAVRSRAAQLREVCATRQARTDQVLAALAEFERVTFTPKSEVTSSGGSWMQRTLTQQAIARAQWLDNKADELASLADNGTSDQVVAVLPAPLPPVVDVEQMVADGVTDPQTAAV